MARTIFVTPANPEAGSGWPILDLTDPIRSGGEPGGRREQKTSVIEFNSSGSPAFVPVP